MILTTIMSVETLLKNKLTSKTKSRGFISYMAFMIFVLIILATGTGCNSKPLKLPQVDVSLAETIVVTRNGWDRDILPSSSTEVKEFIGREFTNCEPIKIYESWDEIFPDGNVYGSPNTVTLIFPTDRQVTIQCFLLDSFINYMDMGESHLYLVDDAWLTNFIETVTAMVEDAPDERYIEKGEPPVEYEFRVMTDDNAPIGCEFGINREGQIDALAMLAKLENLKGFSFPADSGVTLRFSFSQEPEDVYVRFISESHWQEKYPYEDHRIKVPDEPGIYSIFVDIGWESDYFETVFFSVTVREREDAGGSDGLIGGSGGGASQPAQTSYTVVADPSVYDISADSITVKITNTSQAEDGYGYAYRIERNNNGKWESIPLEFDVMEIAAILPAGQTNTEKFSLHREQYDYQSGDYRIVFLDGLGGASAQFTLT